MLDGVADDQLHSYLQNGDRVRIEIVDPNGQTVFGAIDQVVKII
jgi:hypothetical protein